MVALVLLTRAFARDPRLAGLARYSRVTVGLFLLLLVAYVVREGEPGARAAQRLSALVVFAWLAAVAYRLDELGRSALSSTGRRRRPAPQPPTPRAPAARRP